MKVLSATLAYAILLSGPLAAQDGPDPNRPGAKEKIKYDVPAQVEIDYDALDAIDTSGGEFGVVDLPDDVGRTLTGLFSKYTKHVAPNGKPIHIFGQSRVSDLQMARARASTGSASFHSPGALFFHDSFCCGHWSPGQHDLCAD